MTRIHVVSLPHTLLTTDYDWCAYTAKVRRFADILARADIDAVFYGPDIHDDLPVLEYVPVVFEADRIEWFGGPEWDRDVVFDRWDAADPCWAVMNARASAQIAQRWEQGDILGLIGGMCQQQIVTDLAAFAPLVTEWGIGYSGVIPGTQRVYESYAWMHHVAGFYRDDDIRNFDAVIPNCFDEEDFSPRTAGTGGDYVLYMGRPNPRKGLAVVEEIAKRIDLPVLIAGQPGAPIAGTEYVGVVTGQEKADLLAGARCLLTPTVYLEPFGGVAVEAMLSGTPVLASDYGAFTETVQPGVSGYRCRMLTDYLQGVQDCADIDRAGVLEWARTRYTLDPAAAAYGRYLRRISTLYEDGWYSGADSFRPS